MKTAKFLLAVLVLCIYTLSFAQITYVGNSIDSSSRITLVPAIHNNKIDSLVADSTHDSTAVAGIQQRSVAPANHADQGEKRMIFGFAVKDVSWAITSLLALFLIIVAVVKWLRGKKATSVVTNQAMNKTQRFATNVKEKIGAGKQMLTDVCTEKVNLDNNKHVSNFKKLMIFFRDYNRTWMKPVFYSGAFVLMSGLIFVLFIWATKPAPVTNITNNFRTVVAPKPLITPTVVPGVEVPDEPDVPQPPVVNDGSHADIVFYVNAWVDDKGKQKYGTGDDVVYTPTGYVDRFDPLEDVYGLPDPGSNKEPFEDGPDMQVTVRWDFKSVAFGSRCGHNTKVKVTRRWIGAKWSGQY